MSKSKELVRYKSNKMIAGVCAGLGGYLGIDANLVRIGVVVATFSSGFVVGILIYIAAVFLIKEGDPTPEIEE